VQPHSAGRTPRQQPRAVVLDLVDPVAGGRVTGLGRQGSTKSGKVRRRHNMASIDCTREGMMLWFRLTISPISQSTGSWRPLANMSQSTVSKLRRETHSADALGPLSLPVYVELAAIRFDAMSHYV